MKFHRKKLIVVIGSQPYRDLFKRFGHVSKKASILFDLPDRVDMVVLSGGADVQPSLYGGVDPYNLCYTAPKRDKLEQGILELCQKHRIKITGICRGFQFLNVMAGGFMFPHVEGHAIRDMHEVYYQFSGEKILTNSYHHQLVGLSKEGALPIAWAEPRRSPLYVWPKGEITRTIEQKEVEAAIFPKIRAMGVQYHPEDMSRKSFGRMHYEAIVHDFLELSITKFIEIYGRKAENGQRTNRKTRRVGN